MANEEEMIELRRQQGALDEKIWRLQSERDALIEKRRTVTLKICRLTYTCSCVKLNKDIGINDMVQLDVAHRRSLAGVGFVWENLSALKNCTKCDGTGVPK